MKDKDFENQSIQILTFADFFEQCLTLIEEQNELPFEEGTPEEIIRLLKTKFFELFFITIEPIEAVKMHFLSIQAIGKIK